MVKIPIHGAAAQSEVSLRSQKVVSLTTSCRGALSERLERESRQWPAQQEVRDIETTSLFLDEVWKGSSWKRRRSKGNVTEVDFKSPYIKKNKRLSGVPHSSLHCSSSFLLTRDIAGTSAQVDTK